MERRGADEGGRRGGGGRRCIKGRKVEGRKERCARKMRKRKEGKK